MILTDTLSLVFLALVSLLLIVTGILRRPGIGILIALSLIIAVTWYRPGGLAQLGFSRQSSWSQTIFLALFSKLLFRFFRRIVSK